MNIENNIYTDPIAFTLELKRAVARTKRHITYDCYNAIFINKKVVCKKGHDLSVTKLLPIVHGTTSKICQTCPDYDDDVVPAPL